MPDYDFYTKDYLGTAIPEEKFPSLAARAAGVLDGYCRIYQLVDDAPVSRNMAICAMAEVLQEYIRQNRCTQASLGSVSVRYAQPQKSLARRLWQAARVYMDFYRGVN